MTRRFLSPLLALVGVALLPLLFASVMYFGKVGLPEGRVNAGALVSMQPPLTSWALVGAGYPWGNEGKWQLIQVVPACDPQCRGWQRHLTQMRSALGRERHRVQQQLVVLDADHSEDALRITSGTVPDSGIWLADPLGNLVFFYRFDQSPKDVLRDLRRLLKVSKVG